MKQDIIELSRTEVDAVAGGFASLGLAIATSIALQQLPASGQGSSRVKTSDKQQKAVLDFIKG